MEGVTIKPDGKGRLLDSPEARQALTDMFTTPAPLEPGVDYIPVALPKSEPRPATKPRARFTPGKPLTTNPLHPLLKAVDDELVLRGMAYGTRKSYGQHLRNYLDWMGAEKLKAEEATREDIRGYLVQMAQSGHVSAGYCRGARAALILLYETVLKQPGKVSDLPRMKRPQ